MSVALELGKRLEGIVLKRLESDSLVLPVLPGPAAKVLSILDKQEHGLREAVTHLAKDPLLVAQVMRLATSAAMGGRGDSLSIPQAVTRIGSQKLRVLMIQSSAREVFRSRDPQVEKLFQTLWEHSLAVGILARDLAALGGSDQAEAAYLAGILHDIGKPVVATFLLEAERLSGRKIVESDDWLQAVLGPHRAVALALAESWELPEQVLGGIRDSVELDPSDRQCVANYVRFANAIAKRVGIYAGEVDEDDNDALVMIGRSLLGIDDDTLERLSSGILERVHTELA